MKSIQIDKAVQQAVDRLLLEQGGYTPLELLLAEGRLLFADYEDWRAGQVEYLDELLFIQPRARNCCSRPRRPSWTTARARRGTAASSTPSWSPA